ncbi:MAG: hypothetical protein M0R48_07150 [Candidatus Omnitrophica bacterium]|jgi:hypothetical protein|nr:hypothetical protein [Candidatus Omnitrophota bacterium]
MKQKVFYIVFILATVFLLIFINRKSNISQSVPVQKIVQQFSAEEQETLTRHQQSSLPSENKSAITIIKKAQPAKETVTLENKKINTNVSPKKTPTSSSSPAAAGAEGTSVVTEKPVSGVTKIGKRPPKERIEQLRDQGILVH